MYRFDGKRVSRRWHRVLTRARSEGVKFTLNSGRRTLAEQRALYNQNMINGRPRPGRPLTAYPNPVAPHIRVGRADHAIDVDSLDGGETRLQQWLERHGTHPRNTVPGESWHLELPERELKTLASRFARQRARAKARQLLLRALPKRKVSAKGVDMVATFEGFRARMYKDAVGVPTIGFGETSSQIITKYRQTGISRAVALNLLEQRLNHDYAPAVKALKLPLTQAMFDSLASFVYNVGPNALGTNTGIGRALRARQWQRAADELLKWDKAGGKSLPGLTRRRQAERDLFLSDLPGSGR